jgi:extracellular factor (EF) 3-hydroxypalmitic acid methyl ester biosynthesis protein
MTTKITEETLRVSQEGRPARILSLGCGPAREVEMFLGHPLADHAEFCLLDFNEETLAYVENRMSEAKRRHHVSTQLTLIKQSVYHLLKESRKPRKGEKGYDLIYTSGLYDYLTDGVCRALNAYLYEELRPGGILIASNFDLSNPIRNVMEHMFEWFLIHRNAKQMEAIAPPQASPEHRRVRAEATGVNVFVEARKP